MKSIPLAQPDRTRRRDEHTPTLLEIAEQRRAALQADALAVEARLRRTRNGPSSDGDDDNSGDDDNAREQCSTATVGPVAEAFFLASSLTAIHLTLDVLVYNQYRQSLVWSEIRSRAVLAFCALFLLVYLVRKLFVGVARQVLCAVTGAVAGCYLIYAGNTYDYFAVMKRAPPLGVLWVWSVVEMSLPFALGSLAVNAAYMWYEGFYIF